MRHPGSGRRAAQASLEELEEVPWLGPQLARSLWSLLNGVAGFFPFELHDDTVPYTVLYNRTHIVQVSLIGDMVEPQLAPGYSLATERAVRVLLSNGNAVKGRVRVYRPNGRDRLSDYARESEMFRYIETADGTVIVNADHIVELRETTEA